MILKIFSPKKIARKISVFDTTNLSGFWENADFFAENWQKSKKIVIITSTPGHTATKALLMH
jgi:hypothetical protein